MTVPRYAVVDRCEGETKPVDEINAVRKHIVYLLHVDKEKRLWEQC